VTPALIMRLMSVRVSSTLGYEDLRQRILQRDRWTCQDCGRHQNLHVHHLEFRSHGGADEEKNLITLCNECHAHRHNEGF